MKNEDKYYEAMLARDHRFDGKFFIGVKTTGIYCRPICPAKPKKENVEFFPNHFAAEKAGYRPCKRCHPESAPESPVWIGKSAMVQRAIKILNNQETISFDEDQFAALFGVSARHLRRVFVEEVGKTPKQLAFENRLNLSRKLIQETSLKLTEIAFAAGFESIRRFNSAFQDRFKCTPSNIRRKKLSPDSSLTITLPYRPPYDFEGLLATYKSHHVGNLERFEEGKMIRVLSFDDKVGLVMISHDAPRFQLMVEIDFPDTSYIHVILSKVRSLFDLNSDPVVIANALETDKAMKAILKKYPGIRLPSGWDGFEVAVGTILGQLVSVEQGVKLTMDLVELLGSDSGLFFEGRPIKLFPTPAQIITGDLEPLKTTQMRKATLKNLAEAIEDGSLSLSPTQDIEEFYKRILKIQGIGPWTASYIALKAIRHTDAFPATDLILARALEKHSLESLQRMKPWRGYAAVLMWREYYQQLKKEIKK